MISRRDRKHADRLLARACCGNPKLEREARDALARWAGNNDERTAYLRHARAADQLLTAAASALRPRYPRRHPALAAPKRHASFVRGAAICATLTTIAAGLWWLNPPLSRTTLATNIGERRSSTLADGSTVILNTASKVEVVMRFFSRETVLERGEALFEVAPGSLRPFRVNAGDVQLEVVGTVFNVRRAGQGLRVTVLEGKVTVRPGTHSNPVMLTSGYEIESIAGVLATAQRATDLEATLAWREGRLVFNNIRLDQALAEAQRYRRAPIVIADAGVSGLRITGAFPTNDPDRLLKLLPEALPVRVSLLDDGTARVSLRKPDSKAPKIRQEIHAPVLLPRSSE